MDESFKKAIDHPLITEVLFFPRRISEHDLPKDPNGRVERIPAGNDTLGAYWYRPFPESPTVLFFHGNGEVISDYLMDFHGFLEKLSLNFLPVDYRGYGLSTGSPCLSAMLEDARAAWDYAVSELGLSSRDIIIMGRSLGSLAALEIAGGPGKDARALVIESGIARFDNWIKRMEYLLQQMGVDVELLRKALNQAFDHQTKIRSYKGPLLVMHAPNDEIVPVEQGKQLASWADPEKTTLHVFPRGGHNDIQIFNREEYFRVLADFINNFC
ncbi:MAG: alpha/beta hydrolase [bacterium]